MKLKERYTQKLNAEKGGNWKKDLHSGHLYVVLLENDTWHKKSIWKKYFMMIRQSDVISRCNVLVFYAPSASPASFPVEEFGHMIRFLRNTIQQRSLVSPYLNVSSSVSAKLCGKSHTKVQILELFVF